MPASHHFDDSARLRIIRKVFTFEGMVDAAVNMIRQNARSVPVVSIHLLETLATICAQARRDSDCRTLLRQANMVYGGRKETPSQSDDRKDLEKHHHRVLEVLGEPHGDALAGQETGSEAAQR